MPGLSLRYLSIKWFGPISNLLIQFFRDNKFRHSLALQENLLTKGHNSQTKKVFHSLGFICLAEGY